MFNFEPNLTLNMKSLGQPLEKAVPSILFPRLESIPYMAEHRLI
jgi:hypothetical protein